MLFIVQIFFLLITLIPILFSLRLKLSNLHQSHQVIDCVLVVLGSLAERVLSNQSSLIESPRDRRRCLNTSLFGVYDFDSRLLDMVTVGIPPNKNILGPKIYIQFKLDNVRLN